MKDDKKTRAKNMLRNIVASIKRDSKFLKDVVFDETGLQKIASQISDSEYELAQIKAKMTQLLEKALQSSRKLKILAYRVIEQESQVLAALNEEDQQKAYSMATDLAATELEYHNQFQLDHAYKLNIKNLQAELEYAERQQKELVRQLSMADTTKHIQQASDVIVKSLNQLDNKQRSAKATLQRIRARQLLTDLGESQDIDITADQTTNKTEGNEMRLESAEEVLQRLRDKRH